MAFKHAFRYIFLLPSFDYAQDDNKKDTAPIVNATYIMENNPDAIILNVSK